MRSLARRAVSVLAVGALAFAVSVGGSAAAEKDKTPDIQTIMGKVNGKKGCCKACADAGKAAKWEDAQKAAKELLEFAEALGKNKCPKGDEKSWETLTKKYAEEAKAIHDAAEKKDPKALQTAVTAFTDNKSCKGCHSIHK